MTDDSVQAWVQKAFTQELQRSGFTVVSADAAQAILKVSIDEVHCNAYFGYSADMGLRLSLTQGPKVRSISGIKGFGSDGMNWAATSRGYAESLSKSLADSYYQVGQEFLKPSVVP